MMKSLQFLRILAFNFYNLEKKKWDLKKYLKESLSKSQKEIDFALEHYPFSDIDIPRSISVTGVELSQVGEDILYNDGDGISNHRYSERDDQKINFVSEIIMENL